MDPDNHHAPAPSRDRRHRVADLNFAIFELARAALYEQHPEFRGKPLTQAEIAEVLGCDKSRVGLIERRALEKMRGRILRGELEGLAGDLADAAGRVPRRSNPL